MEIPLLNISTNYPHLNVSEVPDDDDNHESHNSHANYDSLQSRSPLMDDLFELSEVKHDISETQAATENDTTTTQCSNEGLIPPASIPDSSTSTENCFEQQQQQQLNGPFISSSHVSDLHLETLQQLTMYNEQLVRDNTETRKRLEEKELELTNALDYNSRHQPEIVSLRSTISELQKVLHNLKVEKDTCQDKLLNLNNEILEIHKKLNQLLCELNLTGEQNTFSFNVNHREEVSNPWANCTISQIHCKLDMAIQQNHRNLTTAHIDGPLAKRQRLSRDHVQAQDITSMDHDHQSNEMNIMEDLLGINEGDHNSSLTSDPSGFCEEIPRNIPYPTQESGNTDTNEAIKSPDEDDDITFIAEVIKCSSNSQSSAGAASDLPKMSNCNNCLSCRVQYMPTKQLKHHMDQVHQIFILNQCKVCGEIFHSPRELVCHEQSAHDYGEHSSPVDTVNNSTNGLTTNTNQQHGSVPSTSGARGEFSPTSSSCSSSDSLSAAFSHPTEMIDTMGRYEQMGAATTTTTLIGPTANPHPALNFSDSNAASVIFKTYICKDMVHPPPAQGESSQIRHELDASRSLPGEFSWCMCGSKYTTRRGLNRHIQSQQINSTSFICGECNTSFSSYNNVKSHITSCNRFSI